MVGRRGRLILNSGTQALQPVWLAAGPGCRASTMTLQVVAGMWSPGNPRFVFIGFAKSHFKAPFPSLTLSLTIYPNHAANTTTPGGLASAAPFDRRLH